MMASTSLIAFSRPASSRGTTNNHRGPEHGGIELSGCDFRRSFQHSAEEFFVRGVGNDGEVIDAGCESAETRPRAEHADDRELVRTNPDLLADRIRVWKERCGR